MQLIHSIIIVGTLAQTCTSDILLDDFKKADVHMYEGANRNFNLVGGDYGQVGLTANYDVGKQHVELTATSNSNFFFSKFDLEACFDLINFKAIEFDIVAPAGSNAQFTLTQRSSDCQRRLVDSAYTNLSQYITPNGRKQRVSIPLTDFAKNIDGGDFDMQHLKDWTLVDLSPVGVKVQISNFVLTGGCGPSPPTNSIADWATCTPNQDKCSTASFTCCNAPGETKSTCRANGYCSTKPPANEVALWNTCVPEVDHCVAGTCCIGPDDRNTRKFTCRLDGFC